MESQLLNIFKTPAGSWPVLRLPAQFLFPASSGEQRRVGKFCRISERSRTLQLWQGRGTELAELIAEFRGRIWKGVVVEQLSTLGWKYRLISCTVQEGRVQVRIYSEELPGRGFESVEPEAEDVFSCIEAGFHHP